MRYKEVWRSIDFKEDFSHVMVSNFGRLRNKRTGKFYKDTVDNYGYVVNQLSSSGETWNIRRHQLVFFAFNKDADYNDNYGTIIRGSMVINHLDENKQNNHLDNLELITTEDNLRYSLNKAVVSININDLSDIKYYNSIIEAEKEDPKNHTGNISQCCLKKQISVNGKYWLYQLDDINAFIEKVKSGEIIGRKGFIVRKIIGVNLETNEKKIYNSQKESEKDGFNSKNINNCLKGRRKTSGGYKWFYLDDYIESNPDFQEGMF